MEWLVETANENYVATGVRQGRRGGRGGGGGRAGEEEELDVAKIALVVASGHAWCWLGVSSSKVGRGTAATATSTPQRFPWGCWSGVSSSKVNLGVNLDA